MRVVCMHVYVLRTGVVCNALASGTGLQVFQKKPVIYKVWGLGFGDGLGFRD